MSLLSRHEGGLVWRLVRLGAVGSLVSLRVSVPKGLVDFLKDLSAFGGAEINVKEWVQNELLDAARATIDLLSDDEYLVAARLKAKYGLLEEKREDC